MGRDQSAAGLANAPTINGSIAFRYANRTNGHIGVITANLIFGKDTAINRSGSRYPQPAVVRVMTACRRKYLPRPDLTSLEPHRPACRSMGCEFGPKTLQTALQSWRAPARGRYRRPLPRTAVAGKAIIVEVNAFAIGCVARRGILRPRSDCHRAGAKRGHGEGHRESDRTLESWHGSRLLNAGQ